MTPKNGFANNTENQEVYIESKNLNSKDVPVSAISEWWQVLTIVTITLSLGSFLLALNQIRPEVYRNEMLIIDQAKASIYLLDSENEEVNYESFNFFAEPEKKDLCEQEYNVKLKSEALEKRVAPIRERESRLEEVALEVEESVSSLRDESHLDRLISVANTTFVEDRLFFEKKYLLSSKQLNIYSNLSALCRSDMSAEESLSQIDTSLEELSDFDGLKRDKLTELKQTVQEWQQLKPDELSLVMKESTELDNFINTLYTLDVFDEAYTTAKNDLQDEFTNLERWQRDFTAEKPELKDKLVLIENNANGTTP